MLSLKSSGVQGIPVQLPDLIIYRASENNGESIEGASPLVRELYETRTSFFYSFMDMNPDAILLNFAEFFKTAFIETIFLV